MTPVEFIIGIEGGNDRRMMKKTAQCVRQMMMMGQRYMPLTAPEMTGLTGKQS